MSPFLPVSYRLRRLRRLSVLPAGVHGCCHGDDGVGQNYIILDVRTGQEFASGHIPGAINIPNESIGSQAPAGLPDKNQLILVYCRSGNRSKQASKKLATLGYTNIVEFGGILDWPGQVETGT